MTTKKTLVKSTICPDCNGDGYLLETEYCYCDDGCNVDHDWRSECTYCEGDGFIHEEVKNENA